MHRGADMKPALPGKRGTPAGADGGAGGGGRGIRGAEVKPQGCLVSFMGSTFTSRSTLGGKWHRGAEMKPALLGIAIGALCISSSWISA